MNGAETYHRHTLVATFAPLTECVCDIQVIFAILFGTIAGTYEVGISVDVGALGIMETTPRYGDEVREAVDVEVAVHAVAEIHVVHPNVL